MIEWLILLAVLILICIAIPAVPGIRLLVRDMWEKRRNLTHGRIP